MSLGNCIGVNVDSDGHCITYDDGDRLTVVLLGQITQPEDGVIKAFATPITITSVSAWAWKRGDEGFVGGVLFITIVIDQEGKLWMVVKRAIVKLSMDVSDNCKKMDVSDGGVLFVTSSYPLSMRLLTTLTSCHQLSWSDSLARLQHVHNYLRETSVIVNGKKKKKNTIFHQ